LDIRGAKEALGALTLQKRPGGVSLGAGASAPDAVFESFHGLRGFLARLSETAGARGGDGSGGHDFKKGDALKVPAVSVIMAVYNGERNLAEAVESILGQTFTDFEFIIVDDASTDRTPHILRRYALKDDRVTILTNDVNRERSVSRNLALARARAELVAVMDADDFAPPDRLEKQAAFMRAHPEITVCGGIMSGYDRPGEIWRVPEGNEEIRVHLFFESSICHPTAMYRKERVLGLAGGYDSAFPLAEDYDLWARLSMRPEARFANLRDVLCRYRFGGKEGAYYDRIEQKANLVRKKLLGHIGLVPADEEFAAHLLLTRWDKKPAASDLRACEKWLHELYAAGLKADKAYGRKALKREMKYRWAKLCEKNLAASLGGLAYFKSGFRGFYMNRLVWDKLKLKIKRKIRGIVFWGRCLEGRL
jgi:glycosyltransferase involved in cell wall biosynthesis